MSKPDITATYTDESITQKLKQARLTKDEELEYRTSVTLGEGRIPPDVSVKIFSLFLNGSSTEEIWRANDGRYSRGQIISARLDGNWDEKVAKYNDELVAKHLERVKAITIESANFVADMLSVANRHNGDKLRKYLQEGNPEVLGDLQITSIQGYKTMVELFQSLTGQESPKPGKRGRAPKPNVYDVGEAEAPLPLNPAETEPAADPVGKKTAETMTLLKAIQDRAKGNK